MKEQRFAALLAAIPGLLVLFSMRPEFGVMPRAVYVAAVAWFALVASISYRRKKVPDWGVPAFGLAFPVLAVLWWLVVKAVSLLYPEAAGEIFSIAIQGTLVALGVAAVVLWGKRLAERKVLLRAVYTSLGMLVVSVGLEIASVWMLSSQRMAIRSISYSLWLMVALASIELLFVLVAWLLAPDRPHLTIGLVGVAGFFLWTFWLEFDYGVVGTGYAYLIGVWFAFWSMVVLPAMSVTGTARRHPLPLMAGLLLIAFSGAAVMEALVRVRPDMLSGILSLAHLPAGGNGGLMAGVGSWAGRPLLRVMLGFLAEYLAVVASAMAAYVFATGGRFEGLGEGLLPNGSHAWASSLPLIHGRKRDDLLAYGSRSA